MMGAASSLWIVLVARVLVGLIKQTTTLATAYVSEVSSALERTKSLARLSTVTGVGFIIGPITGSILSRYDLRLPFFLSALLFGANFVFASYYLPFVAPAMIMSTDPTCPISGKQGDCIGAGSEVEALAPIEDVPALDGDSVHLDLDAKLNPLTTFLDSLRDVKRTLAEVAKKPQLFRVLLHCTLSQAVLLLLETTMLLFLQLRFDIDSKQNGFVMAYSGALAVIINFFLVAKACRVLGGAARSIPFAFASGAFGLVCMGLAPSLNFFLVGMAPFSFGLYVARASLMTLFTQLSPSDQKGAYLGLNNSIDAASRVIMPLVGGVLLEINLALPYFVGGALLAVLALMWRVTQAAAFVPVPMPATATVTERAKGKKVD
jgi:DHA1 family tetracycline resistance protein-like MFS transporter